MDVGIKVSIQNEWLTSFTFNEDRNQMLKLTVKESKKERLTIICKETK